ncbi:MAG: FHA domain-containing protein [Planctomycetia bacterium]|nr:FHA domain-containing protein [Planctomycetia bacterium]
MKRFDVMSVLALGIALLVALPVVGLSQEKQNKKETKKDKAQKQVTLNVEGVECAKCAQVMTSALAEAQLKPTAAIKPDTTGPSRIVATCPAQCDLGAVAAKVNQAATPHREKVPPSLSLVLFANLDEQATSTALATCQKIEGVDGRACQVDPHCDGSGRPQDAFTVRDRAMESPDIRDSTLCRGMAIVKVKLDSVDPFWPELHVTLGHLPAVIGRDTDAPVRLEDRWVSRCHCELSEENGGLVVRDLKSKCGTLVKGQPVRRSSLQPGDHLTVGIRTFRVSYQRPVVRKKLQKPKEVEHVGLKS